MARRPFPRGGIRTRLPVTIYRRASDEFSPTEIEGLALWLDASDGSTLFQNSDGTVPATASSDPVGYWGDKSGNGRHLTQALSGSRPSLLPTGISSKPAMNFDGTDDNIWRQPGLTSNDVSILMVHQTNTLSGGVTYEFCHSGDTTNSQATNTLGFGNFAGFQVTAGGVPTYMCDVVRSFTQIDLQGRSGTAGDITANVPFIATQCASYSATASAIRKQAWTSGKGMLNSGRFNCGGWSAITLGARRINAAAGGINSPSVFFNGRIAEVIAYSRYITDADRRRLELYLARKWSVTLTGAPTVSNAEAQDWIDRVYGNGGSVSTDTAQAVNTLCQSITDAGIRDRFYRMNIFAGSNLNAALTPLYLGPTPLGIRYGNTTDTNVGPFVSGDYNETGASGGLNAGASNSSKYLRTGIAPSDMSAVCTNVHASVYSRAVMSSNSQAIGAVGFSFFPAYGGNRVFFRTNGNSSGLEGTITTTSGHILAVRTSATAADLYRNGSSQGGTPADNGTTASETSKLLVFGTGAAENASVFFPGTLQMYSLGLGMTAPQAASFYSAVQAFQTSLTRNL